MPLSNTDTSAPQEESLFLGLKSYTEKDAARFFGRSGQTLQLYHLVKHNTLTLVFGKSGTGKTSLLKAGVFPKLRNDDCLPFPIRLDFKPESPTLLEQVWQVLKTQIQEYHFKVDQYIPGETLWEFFHREMLWRIVTPILLFDQWEEIFTLATKYPDRKEELDELLTQLADVIENTFPDSVKARYVEEDKRPAYDYLTQKVKVIFAFREDFLAEMESITSKIPSVKNARFRLMPMNGLNAQEVITKTWGNTIAEPEADEIIRYLIADTGDQASERDNERHPSLETSDVTPAGPQKKRRPPLETWDIEPSLLSQVCDSLDRHRREAKLDQVSADFLSKYPKENVLGSIYDKAVQDSVLEGYPDLAGNKKIPNDGNVADNESELNDKELAGNKRKLKKEVNAVKIFIEKHLVDTNGFRDKYVANEIPESILPVIAGLKTRFFVRQEGIYIELAHDVISNVIKAQRAVRLRTEARNKVFVRYAVALAILAVAIIGTTFYTVKRQADDISKNDSTLHIQFATIKNQNASIKTQNKQLASLKKQIDAKKTELGNLKGDTLKPDTDSLANEYQRLLDSLHSLADNHRRETAEKEERIKETTRILTDTIRRYQTENMGLIKRVNNLLVDTMVMHNYSSLVEQISRHRDSSQPMIKYYINALDSNWKPFNVRLLQSRGY